MTIDVWLEVIAFVAVVQLFALQGLAASGHFPSEHRAPSLRSGAGPVILFGSMLLTLAAAIVALIFAWRNLPWQAVIIGGGGALLATPLLLRPFPDAFVNGRSALLLFAGAAALIALAMLPYI